MRQRNGRAVPGLDVAGDGLALTLSNFILFEANKTHETNAATHLHARCVGNHRLGVLRARAEQAASAYHTTSGLDFPGVTLIASGHRA